MKYNNEKEIELKYAKIQSRIPLLLKLYPKQKYDEINHELVQITDYKDQDSGKYKFSRILETYLAIHQIFENYTEHFITNNNKIFI